MVGSELVHAPTIHPLFTSHGSAVCGVISWSLVEPGYQGLVKPGSLLFNRSIDRPSPASANLLTFIFYNIIASRGIAACKIRFKALLYGLYPLQQTMWSSSGSGKKPAQSVSPDYQR